jgi:hypothetical protein
MTKIDNTAPVSEALSFASDVAKSQSAPKSLDDVFAVAEASGACIVAIDLEDESYDVHMLLFQDGSGTFASKEYSDFEFWPFPGYGGMNPDQVFGAIENPGRYVDFTKYNGQTIEVDEVKDRDAFNEACKTIAMVFPDPPEVLRNLIVIPDQEFEWMSDGVTEATDLIVQMASLLLPGTMTVRIRGKSEGGRTPEQVRRDANMMAFLKTSGATIYDTSMEAHYLGEAYAEIEEYGGDYAEASRANNVLIWFSGRVLETIGQPIGWETEYNDGAHARMSGYSAYQASEEVELEGYLSGHQKLRSAPHIQRYLEQNDMLVRARELLRENDFPALFGGQDEPTDSAEDDDPERQTDQG